MDPKISVLFSQDQPCADRNHLHNFYFVRFERSLVLPIIGTLKCAMFSLAHESYIVSLYISSHFAAENDIKSSLRVQKQVRIKRIFLRSLSQNHDPHETPSFEKNLPFPMTDPWINGISTY